MFFSIPAGHKYVDRGDPATPDFDLSDIPDDDIWYDLDMSGIIPVGTAAVVISLYTSSSLAGSTLWFREKGKNNVIEGNGAEVVVANTYVRQNLLLPCNNNRTIQGNRNNLSFTIMEIVVTGWFK